MWGLGFILLERFCGHSIAGISDVHTHHRAVHCHRGLPAQSHSNGGERLLPRLVGFFVFFISILATSKVKQPAEVVFTKFNNTTGWSDGMAFMLGVGSCMYVHLATDGATHITEVTSTLL